MRMFLVGLCDIFLILYITAMSNVSPARVSELTVKDYVALEERQEEAAEVLEKKERELAELRERFEREQARLDQEETQGTELSRRLERLRRKAEEQTRALEQEREELARQAEELEAHRKREEELQLALKLEAEEAQRLRTEREAKEEALEEERQRAQRALEEQQRLDRRLASQEEALRAEREAFRQEQQKLLQRLESTQRTREEILASRERLETRLITVGATLEEEQKRKEDLEKKLVEAEQAAQAAREAAEESERLAARATTRAEETARKARTLAVEVAQTRQRAQYAETRAVKTEKKLQAVKTPSVTAYRANIRKKLVPLEVTTIIETFRGVRTIVKKLRTLPVNVEGNTTVFVGMDDLGIDRDLSPAAYQSLSFRVAGREAHALFLRQRPPYIVGIALGRQALPSVSLLPATTGLSDLMPTLIAVRDGSRIPEAERERGVSREGFVFKRDLLARESKHVIRYSPRGSRGTGDFAEHILEGDHIVDLEGNYVGIAFEENRILRVEDVGTWHRVYLPKSSGPERARAILSTLRR